MVTQLSLFSLSLFVIACSNNATSLKDTGLPEDTVIAARQQPVLQLKDIPLPVGFRRVSAPENSFAAWLRELKFKKDKTVYLFDGRVKPNQQAQYAVIDIPVGKQDLQQCADVVMRLRADYLFASKAYDQISFMDYNGKWYPWKGGADRKAFDNYLLKIFGQCGSASLEKQLRPVPFFTDIQMGNVLIKGGFPGHVVLVSDMAVNNKGEKIFLLIQGYQPAQDMHVLINPNDPSISPWYRIPDTDDIITPEWAFKKSHLRAW